VSDTFSTARPGGRDPKVVVYHAAGCHLCEAAIEVVTAAQDELGFELELVAVDGDPALEAAYRERLPVVELDGEPAFTYFVQPDALREAVLRQREGGVGNM